MYSPCLTNLVSFYREVTGDKGWIVNIVYLYFSKTFDTVSSREADEGWAGSADSELD